MDSKNKKRCIDLPEMVIAIAEKVPKELGATQNPLDNSRSNSVFYTGFGRVAQGWSTAFTRQGSEVQILSRLPEITKT